MIDAENRPNTDPPQAPTPNPQTPPQGYQPSLGRKIFMFLLTLCALIGLWVYYWFAVK
jgi:hypothetical protein